ncbi:DUF3231 family protein [Anaerobacillus sp. CMMVII]|uniref:DUF3231 family protein n=1 Tax=Anaerobacillus sp. CMMVII TaxID=2755588 RepID=UPI0021B7EC04|nr:DUF3231 family protein [Anaerobacillus sp. CMMVII]MCT8136544.1 DUF3231 family protein [Anaerobacillus sp. CMMVII]
MAENVTIPLTSGELGFLWESYHCETMFLCTFQYFKTVADDNDLHKNLQSGIEITESNIQAIKEVFIKEKLPIPGAFDEHDVNLNTPKLYSDQTINYLLKEMSETRFEIYSKYLKMTSRLDIRALCNQFITDYNRFCHQVTETLLNKGLYVRAPQIPYPDDVDFVKNKSYLTGWFGERRPVEANQLAHISLNIQRNTLLKTMLIGFIQTVESDKIRDLLEVGKVMSDKMLESLHLFLKDADLQAPIQSGLSVMKSTKAPFSDRFVLEFLLNITHCAISVYGESLALSKRRDLFVFYEKSITGTTLYANQIANLLIELGYLEQPPIATDYEDLANKRD